MLLRKRCKSGVTPILGTMMLLLIILTMVATVLWWGTPTIRALEVQTQYTSAKGYFDNMNREVKTLLKDGWGCSRSYKVSFPLGELMMYKDRDPYITDKEIEPVGEFRSKTVWAISYNNPSSPYDIVFENFGGTSAGQFSLRRIDSSTPLAGCDVISTCLMGEKKGEISTMNSVTITASGSGTSVKLKLYDASRISINHTATSEIIAEAYVFNLASLAYRYPTDKGTFYLTQQNSGLSTNYPDTESIVQPLIMSETSVSSTDMTLTFYMVDYRPQGIDRTGSGDYQLSFRFSDVGFFGNRLVKDVRICVDGNYQDAWASSLSDRFTRAHVSESKYTGFIKDDNQAYKGVIYNTPTSLFAQHKNLVTLNLIYAGLDVKIES